MKKSRSMRLASALLVLTLLSTCMISGTFAKYVTTANASDKARVAEWGVEITTEGHLFDLAYDQKSEGNSAHVNGNTATVISNNNESVVAPGTKNAEGLKFSITGKPEVAVKIDVVVTDADGNDPVDIFLKAGTYANMTTGTSTATTNGTETVTGEDDEFTFATDYYPIVYTLTDADDNTELAKGNLATIETKLESLTNNFIAPNTDLANTYGNYVLTWEWAFPDVDNAETDQKDTFLGNLAVDNSLTVAANYSLTSDVKIAITVTQVD